MEKIIFWKRGDPAMKKRINVLNEDCLTQIFQYLPMEDKIRIERVSKRWRSASLKSWSEIDNFSIPLPKDNSRKKKIEKKYDFVQLLKRSGRSIKKLSVIENKNERENSEILESIALFCKNLTSLTISLSSTSAQKLQMYMGSWKHLTNLDVTFSSNDIVQSRTEVLKLYTSQKNLKKLALRNISFTRYQEEEIGDEYEEDMDEIEETGNRTFTISETIEDFTWDVGLSSNYTFYPLLTIEFSKWKNLQNLVLAHCKTTNLFKVLAPCAQTLRHLSLTTVVTNKDLDNLNSIKFFVKLKSLKFSVCNWLAIPLFESLAKSCLQLEEIRIEDCYGSEKALNNLALLPKLEILTIVPAAIQAYDFTSLGNMKNLKEFRFGAYYCTNFEPTTIDICALIKIAPDLRILEIYDFDFQFDNFAILKFAETVTKSRTNGVILEILGKEGIQDFTNTSPFLRLRPSFDKTIDMQFLNSYESFICSVICNINIISLLIDLLRRNLNLNF